MQHRKLSIALAGVMLAVASFAASADILFQNLGIAAPPATLGGHPMAPFDQAAQAAIPQFTIVNVIPGNPVPGDLTISPAASKRTVGNGWGSAISWGHGYVGPVFYVPSQPVTLTLPANTRAFYFYTQSDSIGTWNITATTDSGTTSGPTAVSSGFSAPTGANGFGFYTTAGEAITSITIVSNAGSGFAFGEFGINASPVTTCASEGYTYTKLEWCKNICERGYEGSTLNMWIRRWIDRYRQLPYCAAPPPPPPAT